MGTPQVSSTEGSTDTSDSAIVSAACSSNGKQHTSTNQTVSRIQRGKLAKKTATKALSKKAKKIQKATVATIPEDVIEGVKETSQETSQEAPKVQQAPQVNPPRNPQQFNFTTTTQEPFIFNTFNSTTHSIDFQPSTTAANEAATTARARKTARSEATESQKEKAARARTTRARKALARKQEEQSRYSKPTTRQVARQSSRVIDQLEQANQESELSSVEDIDLTEIERQLNEDQAHSKTNFQPSSLPYIRTESRKRKQPHNETVLLFKPRSSQRILKTPKATNSQRQ
jgi:hypothetical protein